MSLISDLDFIIHSLRLSYLRNVDDPYGARIISLSHSHHSNPYILAASLADKEKWPELALPNSPHLSENEEDRPTGFPGATGLRHTQTIMGPSRSGALGLRTQARRVTTSSKRLSLGDTPRQLTTTSHRTVYPSVDTPVPSKLDSDGRETQQDTDAKDPPPTNETPTVSAERSPEVAPKEVVFIPRFKGAAEMEARRRARMQARRQAPHIAVESRPPPPAPTPPTLNPDLSSSDEDDVSSSDDEDPFDPASGTAGDADAEGGMDDGDEFDPDFAANRTPGAVSTSASEVLSIDSVISTSNSYVLNSAGLAPRLSPVFETKVNRGKSDDVGPPKSVRPFGSYVEVLVPPFHKPGQPPNKTEDTAVAATTTKGARLPGTTTSTSELSFARCPIPPIRPLQSSLTAMLASSNVSENPFTELYGAISGRAETASFKLTVFFPHARKPPGKPMQLTVRKDASVEEVIGYSLLTYWEQGWLPRLDEGLAGEEDPQRTIRLSAVGWIMRIAEDDGEVDDEFPPPDRAGKFAKFNFDAYAILEATPAQVRQNQILESKIQRHPSRKVITKKASALTQASGSALTIPTVTGGGGLSGSTLVSAPLSTSVGLSSNHGPLMFLRIRVADAADTVHVSTTISVSSGTYMQEALEIICRKRKLNPNDYALLLDKDKDNRVIPLDRTVQSLEGTMELVLVKRSRLPQLGATDVGKTTDPNASIFKRISVVPEVRHSSPIDVTAGYKKYTIFKKSSVLARTERILAIDGVYIHIMPSTSRAKAVFDSGKTSSYHIKSVVGCQQSVKSSSIFKLMVQRDKAVKRYEFEAESPKLATEIVQTVRNLKAALDRSGTVSKSRRSRQVV